MWLDSSSQELILFILYTIIYCVVFRWFFTYILQIYCSRFGRFFCYFCGLRGLRFYFCFKLGRISFLSVHSPSFHCLVFYRYKPPFYRYFFILLPIYVSFCCSHRAFLLHTFLLVFLFFFSGYCHQHFLLMFFM